MPQSFCPWNNKIGKNKLLSSSFQSEEFEYTNIDSCPLENIETIKLTYLVWSHSFGQFLKTALSKGASLL